MHRLLFEKTGNAVWISHLDLMRLWQRAFQRAGLKLTHTQGFNPRPSVSIALPMSVGTSSHCEILDFDLDGTVPNSTEIKDRLNANLINGVKCLDVYENGAKLKYLTFLHCRIFYEYNKGLTDDKIDTLKTLLDRDELTVPKKSKSGEIVDQNIIPMIKEIHFSWSRANTICAEAVICCQNPTLNPSQITAAIVKYLPEMAPDFASYERIEIYNNEMQIFR